jgi:hypothetical protein
LPSGLDLSVLDFGCRFIEGTRDFSPALLLASFGGDRSMLALSQRFSSGFPTFAADAGKVF